MESVTISYAIHLPYLCRKPFPPTLLAFPVTRTGASSGGSAFGGAISDENVGSGGCRVIGCVLGIAWAGGGSDLLGAGFF